ncbi:MAG: sacsin N-terminal ATP-binding-like domain-containing protein, partial [Promethearchaeota archaeon]
MSEIFKALLERKITVDPNTKLDREIDEIIKSGQTGKVIEKYINDENKARDQTKINNAFGILLYNLSRIIEYLENHKKNNSPYPKRYVLQCIQGINSICFKIQKVLLKKNQTLLNALYSEIKENDEIHHYIKFLFINIKNREEDCSIFLNNKTIINLFFDAINTEATTENDVNSFQAIKEQYSGSFHFFFELLQNAVDAGSKYVWIESFSREGKKYLVFANSGKGFLPVDILGICLIGMGFKNSKNIGYFGIGYKSVAEICKSSYIISEPFKFKLEIPPDDRLVEHGEKINKFIEEIDKLKSLEINNVEKKFNNIFILAEVEGYKDFSNFCKKIDERFLLFLDPLQEITIISPKENEKPSKSKSKKKTTKQKKNFKAIKKNINGLELIEIHDSLYFIGKIEEDLVIDDAQGKDKRHGEVITAIKIKKTKSSFQIEKVQDGTPLYAYFPIPHVRPSFGFILHGHFTLTNSRESLVPIHEENNWKAKINKELLSKSAPKCLLNSIQALIEKSIPDLTTKLIPFEPNKDNLKPGDQNFYVYNTVRSGLINLLKKENNFDRPFWWNQYKKVYVPLGNVLFVKYDGNDKKEKKIIPELLNHISSKYCEKFIQFLEKKLKINVASSALYFSFNKFEKEFCEEIFKDIDNKILDSEKIKSLVDDFLLELEAGQEKNTFLDVPQLNIDYLKDKRNLLTFVELLAKWMYELKDYNFNKKIFNHFILITKNMSNKEFFEKPNSNGWKFQKKEIGKKCPIWVPLLKNLQKIQQKIDKDIIIIPRFCYYDESESTQSLYELIEEYKENYENVSPFFSPYDLFNNVRRAISKYPEILKEDSKNRIVISQFLKLILNICLEIKKRLGTISSLTKLYEFLIQKNKQDQKSSKASNHCGSDNEEKLKIISDILETILTIPIFRVFSKNSKKHIYKTFNELIWGDAELISLIQKQKIKIPTPAAEVTEINNVLKEIISLIKESNISIKNSFLEKLEDNYVDLQKINSIIDENYKEKIQGATPQEIKTILEEYVATTNDKNKSSIKLILLHLFSSEEKFTDFFKLITNNENKKCMEFVFCLTNFTTPKTFQLVCNTSHLITFEKETIKNEFQEIVKETIRVFNNINEQETISCLLKNELEKLNTNEALIENTLNTQKRYQFDSIHDFIVKIIDNSASYMKNRYANMWKELYTLIIELLKDPINKKQEDHQNDDSPRSLKDELNDIVDHLPFLNQEGQLKTKLFSNCFFNEKKFVISKEIKSQHLRIINRILSAKKIQCKIINQEWKNIFCELNKYVDLLKENSFHGILSLFLKEYFSDDLYNDKINFKDLLISVFQKSEKYLENNSLYKIFRNDLNIEENDFESESFEDRDAKDKFLENAEEYDQLLKLFLEILKKEGFKLKDLEKYCLVSNLRFKPYKIRQIKNLYYIPEREFSYITLKLSKANYWSEKWIDEKCLAIIKDVFGDDEELNDIIKPIPYSKLDYRIDSSGG